MYTSWSLHGKNKTNELITYFFYVLSKHRKEIKIENKMESFGFVMTRHVNSEISNHYWQEAYSCIRKIDTKVLVLVVDDNSCQEFIKILPETPPLSNVWFIQSEFPGRGEILGYYYFWKLRPFERAMIMHDSLFIQPSFKELFSIEWKEIKTVRFLWHFPHHFDEPEKEETYIRALQKTGCNERQLDDVVYFHRCMRNEWLGCFGVMSIISHSFLKDLVDKYHMFYWLSMVFSRNERYVMERVFAVLCCIEDRGAMKSLLGDIYEMPRTFHFLWEDYQKGEWKNDKTLNSLPLLKVWSGR